MRRRISRSGIVRRPKRQRFGMKQWVDRLVDVPCFVMGAGPSMIDKDMSILSDYFTIGINRAYYALDPTIMFWQDISFWKDEHAKIRNTQAIKVSRDLADPKQVCYNFYLKGGEFKFDRTKTHILYGRGASGPLAVQLAVSMGARPIIILGMDCKYEEGKPTNFHGDNPHHTAHTIPNCKRGLLAIAKKCPVEIINCSNTDILGTQRNLKEVIKEVDPEKRFKRGRQSYTRQILRLDEKAPV